MAEHGVAQIGPPKATVSLLMDNLGPGVATVLVAPADMNIPVDRVAIYDRTAETIEAGDIVLGVGVDALAGEAIELVRRARDAAAAAVVLKVRSEPSPMLLTAAEDCGVALLEAASELAWGQLHTLLRNAMSAGGRVLEVSRTAAPIGDLFALANAVAAMVGGPTTIEDRHSTVLAYSRHEGLIDEGRRQTILGRRIPDPWMERLHAAGVFRRLWDSNEVVHYSAPGIRPRMVVSVRADQEVLGTIWVAEGETPFREDAEAALTEAARIAALHLLRQRTSDDLERRQQAETLRSVLEGRTPPEHLADILGVTQSTAVTAIALDLPFTDRTELLARSERVVNLIALYSEAFRRQAACVPLGSRVYIVVPDAPPSTRERLIAFVGDIVTRAHQALGVSLHAGVGSTTPNLAGLLDSRDEADHALRVVKRRPEGGPVGDIEELRCHVVLLQLCDIARENKSLRTGKLQGLIQADPVGKKGYVETLRAYLDHFGDIPAASAELDIHHNTFRYRLSRLQELAGIDLDDPVERLITELQLHFLSS